MKERVFNSLKAIFIASMCILLPGCGKGDSGQMDLSMVGYQLDMPSSGEEIAVVNTNVGTFKIRFFPEEAPKAVENFKELSKNGYYNGIIFHRVIKDFMVQGGDPTGTGTGGESVWGENFEDEFSSKLFNITGAVAMANRGQNTNGSQFFINYQNPDSFVGWDGFEKAYEVYAKDPSQFDSRYGNTVDMSKITNEIRELYKTHGGNPHLDGYYSTMNSGHTVFGQVFEGLDVIEKMSNTDTDSNSKPKSDLTIESISIENYEQ